MSHIAEQHEPIAIRRATLDDARAIAEVLTVSWQWAYRGLLPDAPLDRMSDTLERRVETHRGFLANEGKDERTWVIEDGGQVVGFASTMPSRDADASPRTGELGGLYLHPDAAGKGIGRALHAHAIRDLWQRGYEEATLWVLESNARARTFYEKGGWVPDGATKTEERPEAALHQVRYRLSAPVRP